VNGCSDAVILDSNVVIDMLNDQSVSEALQARFPDSAVCVSVITQIEVLSYRAMTAEAEIRIREFFEDIIIIGVEGFIVEAAIDIRRAVPKVKLPDAIIAATAVALDAALVTRDNDLLKLVWPGLQTMDIS
jgi:predicted nucleic acid-binding protein